MSNSLGLVERIFTFLRKKSARVELGGSEKMEGALISHLQIRLSILEAEQEARHQEDHISAESSRWFLRQIAEIDSAAGLGPRYTDL